MGGTVGVGRGTCGAPGLFGDDGVGIGTRGGGVQCWAVASFEKPATIAEKIATKTNLFTASLDYTLSV